MANTMKRLHLFEFEDMPWFPSFLRHGITDFLQFIASAYRLYRPAVARLDAAIQASGAGRIVDLCAGGGGPWLALGRDLRVLTAGRVHVLLTDYYPNLRALDRLRRKASFSIDYFPDRVSADSVPAELKGFRTLFSSFHHFEPTRAKAILQDAFRSQQGIAILESTQRHPLTILYMLLTPFIVLAVTPFIRPFDWRRLGFTYLVPLIPLAVMFDGIVSCLRTYSPAELHALTADLVAPDYSWDIGIETIGPLPIGITYLIGVPRRAAPADREPSANLTPSARGTGIGANAPPG
jgi:hypothetical protein